VLAFVAWMAFFVGCSGMRRSDPDAGADADTDADTDADVDSDSDTDSGGSVANDYAPCTGETDGCTPGLDCIDPGTGDSAFCSRPCVSDEDCPNDPFSAQGYEWGSGRCMVGQGPAGEATHCGLGCCNGGEMCKPEPVCPDGMTYRELPTRALLCVWPLHPG
jgi:hypothetical protein